VQRRFHDLVTAKIRTADAQVGELRAFAEQLRQAAEQLAGEPVDGPCALDCACMFAAPTEPMPRVAVALGTRTVDVPIACTLGADALAA
jgi:hypothetical protein